VVGVRAKRKARMEGLLLKLPQGIIGNNKGNLAR
jgi:hypothetical protein